MQLLITTTGVSISVKNKGFHIKSKEEIRSISPRKISSILFGNKCRVSTAALLLAVQNKIPVYFADNLQKIQAQVWSIDYGSHAAIRKQQALAEQNTETTKKIIELLQLKQNQQIKLLKKYLPAAQQAKGEIQTALQALETAIQELKKFETMPLQSCAGNIMGTEGNAARTYWQALSKALPKEYTFNGRSRQPAKDQFNAALNYLYGLLYSITENALISAGLDAHMGFLHADQYNTPALTFDFIEPFRPWADALVTEFCMQKKMIQRWFIQKDAGYWLSAEGKKNLIPAFNAMLQTRIKYDGKVITKHSAMYRTAQKFATWLLEKETNKTKT